MKSLKEYIIPIGGLREGVHEFEFQIDAEFFTHYEASPIKNGDIAVKFYFEKQVGLYLLIFEIDGKVPAECDRCLEEFELPIQSSNSIIAKFREDEADGTDVIYVSKAETELNIADFVYEFIILSIPLIKKHEDAGEECPEDILGYLKVEDKNEDKDSSEDNSSNPFLDALKDFDKD